MANENVLDHLSNERTFLAWVRTGIALISFGVVIAKLRLLVTTSAAARQIGPRAEMHTTQLGLAFAVVGLLTLVFAVVHYDRTRRAIEAGDYRASGRALLVFVAVISLLGLASVAYLLTVLPR